MEQKYHSSNNSDINNSNSNLKKHILRHSSKFIKNKIIKDNPSIFAFQPSSSFIYETKNLNSFLINLKDKNCLKPTNDEIKLLKDLIDTLETQIINNNNIIYVTPLFSLFINNLKKVEKKIDKRALLIEKILKENSQKGHISIRKITEKYNTNCIQDNLPKISKTQTHRIVKNVLKYSYRKSKLKNNKLLENNSLISSFVFLKIFLRSLKQKIQPIYLDEAGFFTQNNNFYTWKKSEDEIYTKIEDRKRINLIMAVGVKKIFYYELTSKNTDNSTFKMFMNNLVDKMSQEEKENNFIILDNLSSHLSLDLFQFYKENGLKIVFNVPYNSPWNMIELVFRLIKNITYKNIYPNINILENEILNIIKSGKIEKSLPNLYKETLSKYYTFIKNNQNINLN